MRMLSPVFELRCLARLKDSEMTRTCYDRHVGCRLESLSRRRFLSLYITSYPYFFPGLLDPIRLGLVRSKDFIM